MKLFVSGLITLGLLLNCSLAHALVIELDFETSATGSDLMTTSLVTAAGTISLHNATSIQSTPAGSGSGVLHVESANPGFAIFAFDFDVVSLSFTYSGWGGGVFTGRVFDAGWSVVDSFFDPDTGGGGDPFGPVTLSGSGIRYFGFADWPYGGVYAAVDNLRIETASVPEPTTLALVGIGLAGIGFARRQKA
jgi:hypothetical protein